ncbi:MAG: hypothetical protein QXL96_04750 [Ignisphaera sp.]
MECNTFNVKKYGISGRDISIVRSSGIGRYFASIEESESERIKRDLEPILSIEPY